METTEGFGMIEPDDAVMLLIDHQRGLFQTVKTYKSPSCARMSLLSPRSRRWSRCQ